MTAVYASYLLHDYQNKLVTYDIELHSFQDMCLLIDEYPWEKELALSNSNGQAGGFHFWRDEGEGAPYASFLYVPTAKGSGTLDLDVVIRPGFLDVFGRKAISKHFNVVNVVEAKAKFKDLFDDSVEHLYRKYRYDKAS